MLPGICGAVAGQGRIPVDLVASSVDTTDRSGSYTFAGLNFGEDFSNRTLVACIGLFATADTSLNQTSVTIGGSAGAGDDSGDGGPQGAGGAAGAGIWAAKPSGTTGSVIVNFTAGTAQACSLRLYAVADLASATPFAQTGVTSDPDFPTGETTTLNISAGGVLFAVTSRANNTGNVTLVGVTERDQVTVESAHRFAVGYDYRMSAETGRTVGFSGGSANVIYGMRMASFV